MKSIKRLLYTIAGTMIMAWLGNYFYDSTKDTVRKIPLMNYFMKLCKWLYDTMIGILTFQISLWWLILVGIAVYGIYKILKNMERGGTPDFIDYKEDVFKKWTWRWEWQFNIKNGWEIINLTPSCPKDDVRLIDDSDFTGLSYYCPKCNTQYGKYYLPTESPRDTEVLILDKIKKKQYTISS